LQEADAGAEVLKEVLKGTVDSEEAIAAKLAYERKARKDLEVSLEVALKAIQDDQVIIAGKEVELAEVMEAAHYLVDLVETDSVEAERGRYWTVSLRRLSISLIL
jgi:hypothetical protein